MREQLYWSDPAEALPRPLDSLFRAVLFLSAGAEQLIRLVSVGAEANQTAGATTWLLKGLQAAPTFSALDFEWAGRRYGLPLVRYNGVEAVTPLQAAMGHARNIQGLLAQAAQQAGAPADVDSSQPAYWGDATLEHSRRLLQGWWLYSDPATRLCQQAASELLDWRNLYNPEPLILDRETRTITLHGHQYAGVDQTAFLIVETLWAHHGQSVRSAELEGVPTLKGKKLGRELKKLPTPLRAIIKGASGKGRWIEIPKLS